MDGGCRVAEPVGVAMGPGTVYEAVTRQMVEGLTEELKEIKERLNGLLFMVAGAMVIDVALRLTERGGP